MTNTIKESPVFVLPSELPEEYLEYLNDVDLEKWARAMTSIIHQLMLLEEIEIFNSGGMTTADLSAYSEQIRQHYLEKKLKEDEPEVEEDATDPIDGMSISILKVVEESMTLSALLSGLRNIVRTGVPRNVGVQIEKASVLDDDETKRDKRYDSPLEQVLGSLIEVSEYVAKLDVAKRSGAIGILAKVLGVPYAITEGLGDRLSEGESEESIRLRKKFIDLLKIEHGISAEKPVNA